MTLIGVAGCHPSKPSAGPSPPAAFHFEDVTQAAGIDFVHLSGTKRPLDILRTTGSGVAWLDYDRDGWPDLFCVNSHPPDAPAGRKAGHRLYRNRGDGSFEDVTDQAGLRGIGQDGQGVAVADFDGDGWVDLYVTCYGSNHLYRNGGHGRFLDVTKTAGVGGERPTEQEPLWSTSAAWFDADRDGDLDLYVATYCEFSKATRQLCEFGGVRSSCSPVIYPAGPDLFFRNQGGGRLTPDRTLFAHGERKPGRGLGVLPFDADGDDDTDLFVANDGEGNFFFENRGGKYHEIAYNAGLALDGTGGDPAGMGVDVADLDRDGRLDLALANFQDLPNLLYGQRSPLLFQDISVNTGLALATRGSLTFGTGFEDFDLDGRLELLFINGHVQDNVDQIKQGVTHAQKPQLLRYQDGLFEDVSANAGPPFGQPIVGRGSAFADYDRDGDVDVAVSVNGGPTLLWRNDSARGHWLQVELHGERPNREAIGARVRLKGSFGVQERQVLTGRSYLSDSERVLTFGLGAATKIDSLEVRWPDGTQQTVPVERLDQRVVIKQPQAAARNASSR